MGRPKVIAFYKLRAEQNLRAAELMRRCGVAMADQLIADACEHLYVAHCLKIGRPYVWKNDYLGRLV